MLLLCLQILGFLIGTNQNHKQNHQIGLIKEAWKINAKQTLFLMSTFDRPVNQTRLKQ